MTDSLSIAVQWLKSYSILLSNALQVTETDPDPTRLSAVWGTTAWSWTVELIYLLSEIITVSHLSQVNVGKISKK